MNNCLKSNGKQEEKTCRKIATWNKAQPSIYGNLADKNNQTDDIPKKQTSLVKKALPASNRWPLPSQAVVSPLRQIRRMDDRNRIYNNQEVTKTKNLSRNPPS